MQALLYSRRQIAYAIGIMALLLVGAYLACSHAKAAEKDADYYARTGTKPPVQGEFVIGPSLHYSMQFSPGLSFGYRWDNGISLVGDYSVLRLDAQDGEAPFRVGCRDYLVPYTTGSHTTGQVGVTLLVPLRKLAAPAK